MESEDEVVAQFCGVTTATPEQAYFFLESTEWQLEHALQLFFESDGGGHGRAAVMNLADYDLTEDENTSMSMSDSESMAQEALLQESTLDSEAWEPIPPAAMVAVPAPPRGLSSFGNDLDSEGCESIPPAAMVPVPASQDSPQRLGSFGNGPSRPKGKETGNGRKIAMSRGLITTLGDLGKHQDSDSDSEGQEYYAGGEKSGMMVQDPNKKHSHQDVEAIFERVRKLGAQEGPAYAEPPRSAAPGNNARFFSGSSHTLTGEPRQQEQVLVEPVLRDSPPDPIVHNVCFWRNGFTVNEGPLRRLDDPLNLPFLKSINRSECPKELEHTDRSTPVNVILVKRITEDWQAPTKPKLVPFKGRGHTLGSKPASSADVSSSTSASDASRPSQRLIIDDAKPATSIQRRLMDGTRMMARFNTTHTVADIRGFIDAARPGSSGPYQLLTMGFPPVKLTNLAQTIETAGLLNAVVIQKG